MGTVTTSARLLGTGGKASGVAEGPGTPSLPLLQADRPSDPSTTEAALATPPPSMRRRLSRVCRMLSKVGFGEVFEFSSLKSMRAMGRSAGLFMGHSLLLGCRNLCLRR